MYLSLMCTNKKGWYLVTTISSVSSTSSAMNSALAHKTSHLSETTKAQLEALGITVTDGMTEAEAKQKIAEVQAQREAQNDNQQQQGNSSESEILSDAKSLASQVGVSVSSDADVSEILDDIGSRLEAMIEEANNNPAELSQIASYFSQLTSLNDKYDSVQSSQNSLYAAMNMVSTSNKIALGL